MCALLSTSLCLGLGDVCSYSRFNLSLYGNDKYTGVRTEKPGNENRFKPTAQGKMEKSLLSFQEQHPRWCPTEGGSKHGEILQDKIQDFALSQSQLQLGLDPAMSASQQRGAGSELNRSGMGRSGMGRSGLGRSVRFEENTDTITIESHSDNNRDGSSEDSGNGRTHGRGGRRGVNMGGSQSMDMSGMDAFGSANLSSSHPNPFLQGKVGDSV
jgi:hypothetical protein